MHVLILGAGALGSLLGARLSKTRAHITLYSTNERHMQSVQEKGLHVEELDGSVQRFPLSCCTTLDAIGGRVDVVLVVVKSYATRQAAASVLPACHESTLFLTLQNGIGNWEQIADVCRRERVLLGTTAQGATLLEPGRIRHGGNGPTSLGEVQGLPTDRVESFVALFREAGLAVQSSERMQQLIWEKLMVNVGINAITALTGVRNGKVAEVDEAQALSRAAVREALQVAQSLGFPMSDELVERVFTVARATAVNRSSMGQDVDRKKRTEIDAINGAIVRFGDEADIAVPVNRTLTQLIKTLESSYLS